MNPISVEPPPLFPLEKIDVGHVKCRKKFSSTRDFISSVCCILNHFESRSRSRSNSREGIRSIVSREGSSSYKLKFFFNGKGKEFVFQGFGKKREEGSKKKRIRENEEMKFSFYDSNKKESFISILEQGFVTFIKYYYPLYDFKLSTYNLINWIPEVEKIGENGKSNNLIIRKISDGLENKKGMGLLISKKKIDFNEIPSLESNTVEKEIIKKLFFEDTSYSIIKVIKKMKKNWILLKDPFNKNIFNMGLSNIEKIKKINSIKLNLRKKKNRKKIIEKYKNYEKGLFLLNFEFIDLIFDKLYFFWNPKIFQFKKFSQIRNFKISRNRHIVDLTQNPQFRLTVKGKKECFILLENILKKGSSSSNESRTKKNIFCSIQLYDNNENEIRIKTDKIPITKEKKLSESDHFCSLITLKEEKERKEIENTTNTFIIVVKEPSIYFKENNFREFKYKIKVFSNSEIKLEYIPIMPLKQVLIFKNQLECQEKHDSNNNVHANINRGGNIIINDEHLYFLKVKEENRSTELKIKIEAEDVFQTGVYFSIAFTKVNKDKNGEEKKISNKENKVDNNSSNLGGLKMLEVEEVKSGENYSILVGASVKTDFFEKERKIKYKLTIESNEKVEVNLFSNKEEKKEDKNKEEEVTKKTKEEKKEKVSKNEVKECSESSVSNFGKEKELEKKKEIIVEQLKNKDKQKVKEITKKKLKKEIKKEKENDEQNNKKNNMNIKKHFKVADVIEETGEKKDENNSSNEGQPEKVEGKRKKEKEEEKEKEKKEAALINRTKEKKPKINSKNERKEEKSIEEKKENVTKNEKSKEKVTLKKQRGTKEKKEKIEKEEKNGKEKKKLESSNKKKKDIQVSNNNNEKPLKKKQIKESVIRKEKDVVQVKNDCKTLKKEDTDNIVNSTTEKKDANISEKVKLKKKVEEKKEKRRSTLMQEKQENKHNSKCVSKVNKSTSTHLIVNESQEKEVDQKKKQNKSTITTTTPLNNNHKIEKKEKIIKEILERIKKMCSINQTNFVFDSSTTDKLFECFSLALSKPRKIINNVSDRDEIISSYSVNSETPLEFQKNKNDNNGNTKVDSIRGYSSMKIMEEILEMKFGEKMFNKSDKDELLKEYVCDKYEVFCESSEDGEGESEEEELKKSKFEVIQRKEYENDENDVNEGDNKEEEELVRLKFDLDNRLSLIQREEKELGRKYEELKKLLELLLAERSENKNSNNHNENSENTEKKVEKISCKKKLLKKRKKELSNKKKKLEEKEKKFKKRLKKYEERKKKKINFNYKVYSDGILRTQTRYTPKKSTFKIPKYEKIDFNKNAVARYNSPILSRSTIERSYYFDLQKLKVINSPKKTKSASTTKKLKKIKSNKGTKLPDICKKSQTGVFNLGRRNKNQSPLGIGDFYRHKKVKSMNIENIMKHNDIIENHPLQSIKREFRKMETPNIIKKGNYFENSKKKRKKKNRIEKDSIVENDNYFHHNGVEKVIIIQKKQKNKKKGKEK